MSEEEELLFRAVAKCEEALRRTDQEPVAWRLRIGESDVFGYCDKESDADFFGKQSGRPYVKEPLYASPPEPENPAARRLTDEEVEATVQQQYSPDISPADCARDATRSAESALAALWGVKLP